MDEIAGELGMSKKTLYALFRSKHELLEACLEAFIGSIREQIDEVLAQKKTYESKFREIVGLIRQALRPMSRIYLKDMAAIEPELFEKIKANRSKLLQHCFSALLEQGKREGKVRQSLPVPTAIKIVTGILDSVMVPEQLLQMGLSPQKGLALIMDILIRGLL
jgi:AcrR family transcriptional regulator